MTPADNADLAAAPMIAVPADATISAAALSTLGGGGGFWEQEAELDGRQATRRELAGDLLAVGFSAGEAVDILLEAAHFDAGDWQAHQLKRGPRKGQTVYKNVKTGAYRDDLPVAKKGKGAGDGGSGVTGGAKAVTPPVVTPVPGYKPMKEPEPQPDDSKPPASSGAWGAALPPSALQGKPLPHKEVEEGIVRAMGYHKQFKESQDGVVSIAHLWHTAKNYQPDLTVGQFHRTLDWMGKEGKLDLHDMDSPGKVSDKVKALCLTRPEAAGGEGRTYEYAALPRPKDDGKGGSTSPGGSPPPVHGKAK
jgi:hypothetical protein